ncbi:MAG TPA: hypothetical protein VHL11_04715, partial [Phototrophicaceae bacterium]|nr:hypothetical protein [Phototrophicaceae bacterium]
MQHYKSFDPETEMVGQTVLSLVNSIMHNDIVDILKKHGLDKIDPLGWYPVQSVLDVMSDISKGDNASPVFVSIGMAAAQLGYESMGEDARQLPIGDFLTLYSKHYQSRTRYGDAGWIEVEMENERHYVITSRLPFPDDVFYGTFYAYARLFRPANKG